MFDAISKAKSNILLKTSNGFIGNVLLNLKIEESNDIATAATNGIWIKINPNFVKELSLDELIFLLLHEAWHVAYKHTLRLENRDHYIFNIAADYVINYMLVQEGYIKPASGLYDREAEGKTTEQIYNELIKDKERYKGLLSEPDIVSSDNSGETQSKIEEIIVKSALSCSKDSLIPKEIKTSIDKKLNPKIPWQKLLHRYVNREIKKGYSWKKPNKKYIPEYILPSLYSKNKIESLVLFLDVSASVSEEEIAIYLSSIYNLYTKFNIGSLIIIPFSSYLLDAITIKSKKDITNIKLEGREGTDLIPVVDYINKDKVNNIYLIFTDMEFYTNDLQNLKQNTNIIWLGYMPYEPTTEYVKSTFSKQPFITIKEKWNVSSI